MTVTNNRVAGAGSRAGVRVTLLTSETVDNTLTSVISDTLLTSIIPNKLVNDGLFGDDLQAEDGKYILTEASEFITLETDSGVPVQPLTGVI